MKRPELSRLIDRSQSFSPEYGKGLSNHLPMALQALARLGGDDDALRAFDAKHSPRLESRTRNQVGWRERLGAEGELEARFESAREEFLPSIKKRGAKETARSLLPLLTPGVAAGAFHALIRVSHALDLEPTVERHVFEAELASALAYWAASYQSVGSIEESGGGAPLHEVFENVRALEDAKPARLITLRMKTVAERGDVLEIMRSFTEKPETLRDLSRLAAKRYIETRNFTALHLVTSSYAAQNLVQRGLVERERFTRYYALAFMTGIPASLATPVKEARPIQSLEASRIFAIEQSPTKADDHLIKLVDACHQLARLDPEAKAQFEEAASQVLPRAIVRGSHR